MEIFFFPQVFLLPHCYCSLLSVSVIPTEPVSLTKMWQKLSPESILKKQHSGEL